jgi:hypothetical protein
MEIANSPIRAVYAIAFSHNDPADGGTIDSMDEPV